MPNMKAEKDIDKLLKVVHSEELRQDAKRYREETANCLTFARARALALNPAAGEKAEVDHLRSCLHCTARLRSFREQLHPTLLVLLLFVLGRLAAQEEERVRSHVNGGCIQCRCLLATRWVEKAAAAVRAGRRTLAQMEVALSHTLWGAEPAGSKSLRYESHGQPRAPFDARLSQGGLSLVLEETDANELFVRVFTEDEALANGRVHLEVAGTEQPLEAEVQLKLVDSVYQGIHYFSDFSRLVESGVIVVLAVPVSDGV